MATSSSELEERLAATLEEAGLGYYEREYRFHPVRGWRFDFAYPGHRVAVEVEGATWVAGRHTRGSGFLEDSIKYGAAASLGWRVVRVTKELINDGRALSMIQDTVDWDGDEARVVGEILGADTKAWWQTNRKRAA